jgi:hypothetical protein
MPFDKKEYWASKGKKVKPRAAGVMRCAACSSTRGTFQYVDTPAGRAMLHTNCPVLRRAALKTAAEKLGLEWAG